MGPVSVKTLDVRSRIQGIKPSRFLPTIVFSRLMILQKLVTVISWVQVKSDWKITMKLHRLETGKALCPNANHKGDGRVRCIYHTRHGVRQNTRFITIISFSRSGEGKIEIKIEIQLIAQPYMIGTFRNIFFFFFNSSQIETQYQLHHLTAETVLNSTRHVDTT